MVVYAYYYFIDIVMLKLYYTHQKIDISDLNFPIISVPVSLKLRRREGLVCEIINDILLHNKIRSYLCVPDSRVSSVFFICGTQVYLYTQKQYWISPNNKQPSTECLQVLSNFTTNFGKNEETFIKQQIWLKIKQLQYWIFMKNKQLEH